MTKNEGKKGSRGEPFFLNPKTIQKKNYSPFFFKKRIHLHNPTGLALRAFHIAGLRGKYPKLSFCTLKPVLRAIRLLMPIKPYNSLHIKGQDFGPLSSEFEVI
jgi:hypothetical protein